MRSFGWIIPFPDRSWDEIAARYAELAATVPGLGHLAGIVVSIRDSPAARLLAGHTSMFDLVVAARPVADPPLDVIIVRTPGSLRPAKPGQVRIEHQTHTGHDDAIERPVDDAIRLFWRFSIEKFGVHPTS
jgi:hypothetical protein